MNVLLQLFRKIIKVMEINLDLFGYNISIMEVLVFIMLGCLFMGILMKLFD